MIAELNQSLQRIRMTQRSKYEGMYPATNAILISEGISE